MNSVKARKWLVMVALFIVMGAAISLLSVKRAAAVPPNTWTRVYYSNPDFTGWLGERTLECSGQMTTVGSPPPPLHADYSRIEYSESCGGGGYRTTCSIYTGYGWAALDCGPTGPH